MCIVIKVEVEQDHHFKQLHTSALPLSPFSGLHDNPFALVLAKVLADAL
jgi:hypothetical protein